MRIYQSGRSIKRRGFNLVEAAIVLGVVGLVIGGIWVASASSRENERITRSTSQIMQIATNLRTLLQNESIGWGSDVYNSDVNTGFNETVFPGDALSGTTPKNPWGLRLTAGVVVNGTAAEYIPTIEIATYVPDVATCSKVAAGLYAALKGEKNLLVNVGSDGYFGVADDNPLSAVAFCTEAYDNRNGEMLYINASFAL